MTRSIVGVMVFVLLSVAAPVAAQYAPDRAGGQIADALRFHLDLTVLRYLSVTESSGVASVPDQDTNVLSFGGDGLYSSLLGGGGGGVGLGYALSDSVVIGAALALGHDALSNSDSPDSDTSVLTLGLEPYVEYLGGEGSTKPFVGATLYVRHRGTSRSGGGSDSSQTFVGGGLLGGVYFFVSEGCSIDLTGKLTYGGQVGGNPSLPSGASVSMLDFLITVGVSAWIL